MLFDMRKGDCLELLPTLAENSIDLILTDVPYGTTACKWDTVIPLEPMWQQLKRIVKPGRAIVMTASQPFTTTLIASNMKQFRYCWIYHKNCPTGFLNARKRPLSDYEDVCVFSDRAPTYFPQGVIRKQVRAKRKKATEIYGSHGLEYTTTGTNYPRRILKFKRPVKTVHPTQKPVALMEYMIKTYTKEGETVLDFTMGSGTTGVACRNTGRRFIGFEMDDQYFEIALGRVEHSA